DNNFLNLLYRHHQADTPTPLFLKPFIYINCMAKHILFLTKQESPYPWEEIFQPNKNKLSSIKTG
ncbi:MAG: hypothetical protein KA782_05335, partial [Flavobacterium sp.]|nr:hypothetical protein [Flavobacterium sp.]